MHPASNSDTARPRRKRWRLTPRFWLLIAAIFMIYMATSYVQGFIQISRIKKEIRRVQEEIAAVEAHNERLRQELIYLQSDEYIEKVARQELGLVRPGETAVKVSPSGQPTGQPTGQE